MGLVTDIVSSLIIYKLELTMVVDPVRMETINFTLVKTHLVLAVAVAEAGGGVSDRYGLVVGHVQVGIDDGSGPGEDG